MPAHSPPVASQPPLRPTYQSAKASKGAQSLIKLSLDLENRSLKKMNNFFLSDNTRAF